MLVKWMIVVIVGTAENTLDVVKTDLFTGCSTGGQLDTKSSPPSAPGRGLAFLPRFLSPSQLSSLRCRLCELVRPQLS